MEDVIRIIDELMIRFPKMNRAVFKGLGQMKQMLQAKNCGCDTKENIKEEVPQE